MKNLTAKTRKQKMTIKRLTAAVFLFTAVASFAQSGGDTHQHAAAPAQKKPEPAMPGMNMPPAPAENEKKSEPAMPGMNMPPAKPLDELLRTSPSNFLPAFGASQREPGARIVRLQELEETAMRNNPTLRQAEAGVRAAKGRRRQAGLWPNPTVGYSGEEIRGGQFGGGQHGGFVGQTFVLGGKLAKDRAVAGQDIRLMEIEAEEQKLRVTNAVRIGYFQVLAAQELWQLDLAMAKLAGAALETAQRFHNIGQNDSAEVLQAEIELRRAELAARVQESRLKRDWRSLAAVAGEPAMPLAVVEGNISAEFPALDADGLARSIAASSPATRIAQATVARAEAMLVRARSEPIPNLSVRAGVMQNFESLETVNRPVGLEGFAEVGIQIPLFNRNQGNTEAARADVERAKQEVRRVSLALVERAATVAQNFAIARDTVETYRNEMLPRAQQLFTMQLQSWGRMTASYPQVLAAQRGLFDLQAEYINALEELRTTSLALQGFLLTDGLEAPARPGEVDTPVREINLPAAPKGMER